ncbi:hypothetical protein Tco_0725407 [Tanacetum coccineum]|uniref:Uncharacterized protein n=1 Tax=Tanacetum coccineum TaxID=301880 RepID=A0ABQ4YEY2_9ASTR
MLIGSIIPPVVERPLHSREYKQSLSVPFNFALQTGWGQGLAEGRSEKELHKIMMRMNGFDPYSDKKMTAEYERDAPKAGSGGIAFAPKLVRAAGVAGSKDTASKEFSRSKTGPSPQDPASKHVSEGSKAPPSKKT